MATIHKLTKDGATIFPATITDAVVHPQTGKTLTSMMKDYNVSELFPTEGVDGGNKYNLALAIQVLGTHLTSAQKTGGIKLTFISSVSPYPEEEYYLGKSQWSASAADWDQRFEVGDVVADPSGSWEPGTAEAYIDQQVATVTGNLASETLARQTADQSLQNQINAEATTRANVDNTKADKATTLAGYGITNAYTKTEVNDLVDTPHQNYVTVQTYSALPATGSADTIYRVSSYDGSVPEVNVTKYSEYAWSTSLSQYIFLCVKSQIDEVFDITVYHSNTTYSDLAAALGTNGDNIPSTLRRGGMSIKYVQTSDNKYVQYRLIKNTWSTVESDWQGVEEEPTAFSKNLIESGGVYKDIHYFEAGVQGYFRPNGTYTYTTVGWYVSDFISVCSGMNIKAKLSVSYNTAFAVYYAKDKETIVSIVDSGLENPEQGYVNKDITVPDNAYYVRFCHWRGNSLPYNGYSFGIVNYDSKMNEYNWNLVKTSVEKATESDAVYIGNNKFVKSKDIYSRVGISFNERGYLKQDGTVGAPGAISWYLTDYIPVSKGDVLNFKVYGQTNATAIYALYDKAKICLGTLMFTEETYSTQEASYIVPELVCYVRSCTMRTDENPDAYFFIKRNISEVVNNMLVDKHPTFGNNFVDKPFAFNGKTAAFFGDSVTVGVASDVVNPLTTITECYRKVFCDKVGLTGTSFAVSGSYLYDPNDDARLSIKNVIVNTIDQNFNFDYVFIAGGINDFWTGKNLGSIGNTTNVSTYGALHLICEHLKNNLPATTKVIFLTPINCSKLNLTQATTPLNEYRDAIFKVATCYGYNVVDMSIIGFPNRWGNNSFMNTLIADGVHPTEEGHKMMGLNLASILL